MAVNGLYIIHILSLSTIKRSGFNSNQALLRSVFYMDWDIRICSTDTHVSARLCGTIQCCAASCGHICCGHARYHALSEWA